MWYTKTCSLPFLEMKPCRVYGFSKWQQMKKCWHAGLWSHICSGMCSAHPTQVPLYVLAQADATTSAKSRRYSWNCSEKRSFSEIFDKTSLESLMPNDAAQYKNKSNHVTHTIILTLPFFLFHPSWFLGPVVHSVTGSSCLTLHLILSSFFSMWHSLHCLNSLWLISSVTLT